MMSDLEEGSWSRKKLCAYFLCWLNLLEIALRSLWKKKSSLILHALTSCLIVKQDTHTHQIGGIAFIINTDNGYHYFAQQLGSFSKACINPWPCSKHTWLIFRVLFWLFPSEEVAGERLKVGNNIMLVCIIQATCCLCKISTWGSFVSNLVWQFFK